MSQKNVNKFLAGAVTATMVATAVVTPAAAASFKDISNIDANTQKEIERAVDLGYFVDAEQFNPKGNITRGQVAKVMAREIAGVKGSDVAGLKAYVEANNLESKVKPFTDVKNDGGELYYASLIVKDAGAFTMSKLNWNDDITRSQMAKVIVGSFGLEYKADNAKLITDIDNASTKYFIQVLASNDVTKPQAGKFYPVQKVTRQQMASFVVRAHDAASEQATVASVKAINNTTVEVTYKDAVEDVKALNFAIEGLTVESAVVKQTDAKTVVLTTSVQEGNKEYTVKESDAVIGKFTGISAVIPTGITVTTPSVQGTIGKEVTVSAQVTVPEGQAKAGIPVTFNIVNDSSNLNSKIEVVAYTDANGVASHSYTRYYADNDSVVAYATQKSSHAAHGKVYWANAITLTEVTETNDLANGAKKVYKVKTNSTQTAVDPAGNKLYDYVNVAFVENTNVTPDKLVRDVEVIDTGVSTNAKYPSQVTTGGVQEVRVKVNAAGEATFTLTGANASVTPVVFVDSDKNGKLGVTELQAQAPTVKFDLKHTLGLDVKAEGLQNAAAINANGIGQGGRDYTVTVTDKEGKLAPEGTLVHVVFPEGSFSTDKAVYFNGTQIVKDQAYTTKVGKEGKAKFTLTGAKDGYAAPTVFIDNGTDNGKLDKNDLQTVGEKTFFVNAVINNATLVAEVNGKEVVTTSGSNTVDFIYTSVDQNGKKYAATTSNYEVSYEVTAQFGDIYAGPTYKLVKKGTTETVKVNAVNGVANLQVKSVDPTVASQVTVNASASQISLPGKSVTVNFTASNVLPAIYTGNATFDKAKEEITFVGYKAVSYANATFKNAAGVLIDKAAFEALLTSDKNTNNYSRVTSTRDANGVYHFEYLGNGTSIPTPPVTTTGTIQFTNATFNASLPQEIVLVDADLNTSSTTAQTTVVKVTDQTNRTISVTLTEDGLNSSTFKGTLSAADIATLAEGNITVTYTDAADATGKPAVVTANAELDMTPPKIDSAKTVQTNASTIIKSDDLAGNLLIQYTGTAYAGAYGNELTVVLDNSKNVADTEFNLGVLTIGVQDSPTAAQVRAALAPLSDFNVSFAETGSSLSSVYSTAVAATPFKGGKDVITVTYTEQLPTGMGISFDAQQYTLTESNNTPLTYDGSLSTSVKGVHVITLTEASKQVKGANLVTGPSTADFYKDPAGNLREVGQVVAID